MDHTVDDILRGALGDVVRIAALVVVGVVALWAITGVNVLDDDGETRRRRPLRRVVLAVMLSAVLAAVAWDPVWVVTVVRGWGSSLWSRLGS